MSLKRFRHAYAAAYGAFIAAWDSYDAFEAKREEIRAEEERRRQVMKDASSGLTDSDKHFVNSFLNNLTKDELPSREKIERFATIVAALETNEARVMMIRRATNICPKLLASPPMARVFSRDLRPAAMAALAND